VAASARAHHPARRRLEQLLRRIFRVPASLPPVAARSSARPSSCCWARCGIWGLSLSLPLMAVAKVMIDYFKSGEAAAESAL
jgi:hypothetical protein